MFDLFDKHPSLQPMTGLDAAFLYLETPTSPMHVGGLSIMDGSLTYDRFRELLLSRLHLVKVLTQRLVSVPLNVDRPFWMDDPNFNIDWHLHHTALPKPGDWKQLRKLCSRHFGLPLDRSRPLWEMVFVEGLDNIPQIPPGSVAVINKIHHAAIDGMSGADIVGMLFDLTPDSREIPPPPPRDTGAIPGDLEMLARTAVSFAARPRKLPGVLAETVKAGLMARFMSKSRPEAPPTLPFAAPPTPFNAPISAQRSWNVALLSLDRIKHLKRLLRCTVNDVVLGICSGALRRYLQDHDALPDEALVAMVPVSIRSAEDRGAMGNQVSAMFIQLATEVADPLDRMSKIMANAKTGKGYQGAIDAKTLLDASEFIPFGLAGQAAQAYSRAQLSNHHRPIFNCTITNVPGPQVPLYLAGSQLLAQMASAPILDGMGLMLVVTSYNGVLAISPTSSPKVMPDLDTFTRYLWESANELEEAVLNAGLELPTEDEKAAIADVKSVFEDAAEKLADGPKDKPNPSGVYAFDVAGEQAQQWVFDLVQRRIYEGESDEALCTLRMKDEHFLRLASGDLDGAAAFMQGKLKVDGDINAAIRFGKILAKLAGPVAAG